MVALALLLLSLSTSGCATIFLVDDLPVQHEASIERVDKVYATTEFWRTVCAVASGSYGLFDRFENRLFCGPDNAKDYLYLEEGDRFLPKSDTQDIPFTFADKKLLVAKEYGGNVPTIFRGVKPRTPFRYALLPLSVALDIVTSPFQLGYFIANPIYPMF
jgi:hypothetical protein